MSNFAYLHLHTHFSIGGGPHSPRDWCRRAQELGYSALGVVERGPLAGLPSLLRAASQTEVTPVIGVEVAVLLPGGGRKATPQAQGALLFARNREGLHNLFALSTLAYSDWPQVEEPVSWEALLGHSAGLVAVLPGGDEAGALSPFMEAGGKRLGEWGAALKAAFGDAAFVGVPHAGRPGDHTLAQIVVDAAKAMSLPPLALPTARYLHTEDAPAYEALKLARLRVGWPRSEGNLSLPTTTTSTSSDRPGPHYLRPPAEAAALFESWPQAVENVARVIMECDGRSAEGWLTPPSGDVVHLTSLAEGKLLSLLGVEKLPQDAGARLRAEIAAVEKSGRAGAWLALAPVGEMARPARLGVWPVPLGAPLGSADGSLLAYALGVSPLNPMAYPAPRWATEDEGRRTKDEGEDTPDSGQALSTGSPSSALSTQHSALSTPLPGIEVPANRRDDIVAALARETGPRRAALAACALDITPAQAVQAAAGVLDVKGEPLRAIVLDALVKGWDSLLSDEVDGKAEALPQTPHSALRTPHSKIAEVALALRGAPLLFRPDPDTLLASPRQVYGELTLNAWLPMLGEAGAMGDWAPWSEEALCSLGYPALTLQPSATLSALSTALSLATLHPTPDLPTTELDLSLPPTLSDKAAAIFTKGELAALPYLLPDAAKDWKGEVTLERIAALITQFKVQRLMFNAHNKVHSVDIAIWKEKTEDTGCVLLYRDQLDAMLGALGVLPGEISSLRRALLRGESDGEDWTRFLAGCLTLGIDGEQASALWSAMAGAAPQLLSRQGATAWARAALWSAQLKAAHPAALLAGALASAWELGGRDAVEPLAKEARRLGVAILPPDVDKSAAHPTLHRHRDSWAVLWGLAQLPGWSGQVAGKLVAARPKGGIPDLREFARAAVSAKLSLSQLETLVKAGGCRMLGGRERRGDALLAALPSMLEWAEREHSKGSGGQAQLNLFTLQLAPQAPPAEETSTFADTPPTPSEQYAQREWEAVHIGVAWTEAAPMLVLRQVLNEGGELRSRLMTSRQIAGAEPGASVLMVGLLCDITLLTPPQGKNGKDVPAPMAVACLEDLEGSIELVAFPPGYKRHGEHWVEGALVIVTARASRHPDGETYLLCEQLAPYHMGVEEDELNLKIKASRKGARPSDTETTATISQPEAAPLPIGATVPLTVAAPKPNGGQSSPLAAQPMRAATAVAPEPPKAANYRLVITLPSSQDDHADIDLMIALNNLLTRRPGPDVVTLHIPYSPETGGVAKAQLPRGVAFTPALEAEVHDLLGLDALAVIRLVS